MCTQKRVFQELPTCNSICTIRILLTQLGYFNVNMDALDGCRRIRNAGQVHI